MHGNMAVGCCMTFSAFNGDSFIICLDAVIMSLYWWLSNKPLLYIFQWLNIY